MANATVTLKAFPYPQGIDNSQRRIHVLGTATIAASPLTYVTGGIPITWQFVNSLNGAADLLNTNAKTPIMAYFTSTAASGYVYQWYSPTNTLRIFQAPTSLGPLVELTGGVAIPAGVSSDTIVVEAQFVRANS